MRNIKNITSSEKRIQGVGIFKAGESKLVKDSIANCMKHVPNVWEVEEPKKQKPKKQKYSFGKSEKKEDSDN